MNCKNLRQFIICHFTNGYFLCLCQTSKKVLFHKLWFFCMFAGMKYTWFCFSWSVFLIVEIYYCSASDEEEGKIFTCRVFSTRKVCFASKSLIPLLLQEIKKPPKSHKHIFWTKCTHSLKFSSCFCLFEFHFCYFFCFVICSLFMKYPYSHESHDNAESWITYFWRVGEGEKKAAFTDSLFSYRIGSLGLHSF